MNRSLVILATILGLGFTARPAQAQFGLGAAVVWGDDPGFGVGGRLVFNLLSLPPSSMIRIQAMGAFDYFFDCEDCTRYEITPAAVLSLGIVGFGLYGGVGANIERLSLDDPPASGTENSETRVRTAFLIGARIPLGVFGEFRNIPGASPRNVIALGLRFGL
jgi:hypothetical protein